MAQFYTLEEAARVLGMSPSDLKAKAQSREVRAFLDGGSWRFRVVDIDELARRRGMGSDADLRLSDLEVPVAADEEGGSAEDILSEYSIGVADPDLGPQTINLPHVAESGSDHDLLVADLSLPPGPVSGSSSVIIGMAHTSGKLPTDSDVRLVPDNLKGASDSDVRLASPTRKAPSDSDVTLIAEDTTDHGVLGPGSGDTAIRQSPVKPGKPVKPAKPGKPAKVGPSSGDLPLIDEDGSDFDLTPSSVIDALQPDSGSDFELSAIEEASDEFEATPLAGPSDSDVTAADPGYSGINLSRPSDSGINLQGASGFNLGDSIELAPLSGDEMKPVKGGKAATPAAPSKPRPALAETPPPSSPKGEKDIFDDTDFEVDAFDSSGDSEDKTMQLEAASDFELEESDTGSEVFAIDEEDVDHNAATAMGPATFEEGDDDEEVDPFEAASGEMASAWDVESEGGGSTSTERAAPAAMLASSGAAQEWGGLWIGFLAVATVFMLFLGFVSIDLVRNLYEFQGDGPGSGIVKSIAGLIPQ